MKRKIPLASKLEFLASNLSLASSIFEPQHFEDVRRREGTVVALKKKRDVERELVALARRILQYSKKTVDCDILSSLERVYKQINQKKNSYNI